MEQEIISDLTHQTDGPVTKHVVIFRAIELAYKHAYTEDSIAEALYNVLEDFVELPSNEFVQPS